MRGLKVHSVRDFGEFESLEKEWDLLVDSLENPIPFMTHAWVRAWWRAFGGDSELYIITVRDGDELIGIFPLRRTVCGFGKIFKFRCLRSLTDEDYEWGCRPQDQTRVLSAVTDHLMNERGLWDAVRLEWIAGEFDSIQRVSDAFRGRGRAVFVEPQSGSYYIDINEPFESYFNRLNKSFRKTRRNINNKLSQRGGWEFKVTGAYDPEALDCFYALEDSGWKKEKGTSIKTYKTCVDFYNDIARIFSEKKQFLLATLCFSGEPVASMYGLLFNGVFYFIKIGANYSNPSHAKNSPGETLVYHMIKYCFDEKMKGFYFFGEPYPYEAHWTRTIRPKNKILIFNTNEARVRLYVLLKRALVAFKACLRQVNGLCCRGEK